MLTKILKKDLLKRKGINIIVFLFILIATIFLATSLNNILSVSNGIDYFLEKSKFPDFFIQMEQQDEKTMRDFLENEKSVSYYGEEDMVSVSGDKFLVSKKQNKKLKVKNSLYLGTVPKKYSKIFDENNKSFQLKKGEVAVGREEMEQNDLKAGDILILKMGKKKYSFKIKNGTKDAAFCGGMSGVARICLNDSDYQDIIEKHSLQESKFYYVFAKDMEDYREAFQKIDIKSATFSIDKSQFRLIYSMEMLLPAMLILFGICFILISFLVLRFTLVFTMEENYSEIGIMQALGIPNNEIKKIYLVKYFLIVSVASILGLVLSIPIAGEMLLLVSKKMCLPEGSIYLWSNIAGALFVMCIVLAFCYGCTRRIHKFSAITIIRDGDNGERYTKRRGLELNKRKRLKVPVFLGINDILCHKRRYFMLFFTFCVSFWLISIPLNTVNTMKSTEMIRKFALDPKCQVFIPEIDKQAGRMATNRSVIEDEVKKVEDKLVDKGYDVDVKCAYAYQLHFWKDDKDKMVDIAALQVSGDDSFLDYSDGEAPKLENEIAVSQSILEKNHWKIGDTITTTIQDKEYDFIITATYADYMQMGESVRLNRKFDMGKENIIFCWQTMLRFDTDLTKEELKKELKKEFPEYKWTTAQKIVNDTVGSIQESLETLLLPLTIFLCGVIALIVIMMEQLFIVREKGEIAMMKSIGFNNSSIGIWQVLRMFLVALSSMVISIPLSLLSNEFILKPVFAIMGAEVTVQVDKLQAYVIYPAILFVAIIISTILASLRVKKIRIQDLNNLE